MATGPRRRYTFRDRETTGGYVAKLGTNTARAFFVAVERPDLSYLHLLALLAFCHHLDLISLAPDRDASAPVFPEDVADIMGVTANRAGVLIYDVKRLGLLAGSAAGGYRLAGLMVAPREDG